MSLLSNLFLVVSLAALSLAACTGDVECVDGRCQVDSEGDSQHSAELDLVRIEIEVDGEGTVFVDGEDSRTCTSAQGLCSFSYARGSEVFIYAETGVSLQDACDGSASCEITLATDQVVVANFEATSAN